ncbi:MAG: glycoside hydrolase family 9 protein [Clostridiales bacterium]|nr:glycoside hydrolase family 9 protein [Clostridiales bacterium]
MKKKIISIVLVTSFLFSACVKTSKDNKEETSSSDTANNTSNKVSETENSDNGALPDLVPAGKGYTGTKGSSEFNYGEALQKSLLFYELQRSGDLPEDMRCNWRGDSGMEDGKDNGVDLTGGLYDAGDHVKFNLPMAYTASMLGWSVYEDKNTYVESGELKYALGDIKWITDYLIKCHTEDEVFYYQVGDGGADHSWWGPCEVMSMNRPSYKVTVDSPGSAVTGEAAAALAIASVIFESEDKEYSDLCLTHAKSLYAFSAKTLSDSGYTAAAGFYDSWSGFYDELSWAGIWLYIATGEDSYLESSKEYFDKAGHDFNWALCWDDVHIADAVMLARITGEEKYKIETEYHLDFWSCGTSDGQRITYTPKGLAWLDSWGSLRYATTTAFVAALYSRYDCCSPDKKDIYWDFAVSQADYALGSTGFSYQIGFGNAYPMHPHHRTSQGSYCDNMNEPSLSRHTLYGALVGGPDSNDNYYDTVSDYCANEVACDYNAGFTGLLAAMYSEYKGETLVDFGAFEEVQDEYSCDTGINVDGSDFTEIKAIIYNKTAWPARKSTDLEFRYFIDLSEVYSAGGDASGVQVSTNYMKCGRSDGLKVYDEAKHIYYLSVVFDDGELYPGGQDHYKSEVQVRMTSPNGSWDKSNDWSYNNGGALYEGGKLVFGTEPGEGGATVTTAPQPTDNTSQTDPNTVAPTAAPSQNVSADGISLTMTYTDNSSNQVAGNLEITNGSDGNLDLSAIEVCYYLTNDDGQALTFDCYHASVTSASGQYTEMTSKISGTTSSSSGTDSDTVLTIKVSDGSLAKGDKLTINFSLHRNDWQNMDLNNDHSHKSTENIVVKVNGNVALGKEP